MLSLEVAWVSAEVQSPLTDWQAGLKTAGCTPRILRGGFAAGNPENPLPIRLPMRRAALRRIMFGNADKNSSGWKSGLSSTMARTLRITSEINGSAELRAAHEETTPLKNWPRTTASSSGVRLRLCSCRLRRRWYSCLA